MSAKVIFTLVAFLLSPTYSATARNLGLLEDSSGGRPGGVVKLVGWSPGEGLGWISPDRNLRVCSLLKGTCCELQYRCCEHDKLCCDPWNWFYPAVNC